jgi:hypothetical protein
LSTTQEPPGRSGASQSSHATQSAMSAVRLLTAPTWANRRMFKSGLRGGAWQARIPGLRFSPRPAHGRRLHGVRTRVQPDGRSCGTATIRRRSWASTRAARAARQSRARGGSCGNRAAGTCAASVRCGEAIASAPLCRRRIRFSDRCVHRVSLAVVSASLRPSAMHSVFSSIEIGCSFDAPEKWLAP